MSDKRLVDIELDGLRDTITSLRAEVAHALTIEQEDALRAEVAAQATTIAQLRAALARHADWLSQENPDFASLTQELETEKRQVEILMDSMIKTDNERDVLRERLQSIENICDRAGKGNLHALSALMLIGNVVYAPPLPANH